jgi:hypothetical protein
MTTTRSSILGHHQSSTDSPIVFTLSPELQGNIPDGYELIPVDQLTNEYEVVPFDKVIQVLNVSSVNKIPEGNVLPTDVHHISKQLSSSSTDDHPPFMYPPYGKLGPHTDHLPNSPEVNPAYKMLPPLDLKKSTTTKKPIYLPSFFSDTNKLLTMYKLPPFSPDLHEDLKSANSSPDLPSLFYNDIPRPGNKDN